VRLFSSLLIRGSSELTSKHSQFGLRFVTDDVFRWRFPAGLQIMYAASALLDPMPVPYCRHIDARIPLHTVGRSFSLSVSGGAQSLRDGCSLRVDVMKLSMY
jgi:hypothetical protein